MRGIRNNIPKDRAESVWGLCPRTDPAQPPVRGKLGYILVDPVQGLYKSCLTLSWNQLSEVHKVVESHLNYTL